MSSVWDEYGNKAGSKAGEESDVAKGIKKLEKPAITKGKGNLGNVPRCDIFPWNRS